MNNKFTLKGLRVSVPSAPFSTADIFIDELTIEMTDIPPQDWFRVLERALAGLQMSAIGSGRDSSEAPIL